MLLFFNDTSLKMSWHRASILLAFGCLLQCSFSENRSCQQQVPSLEALLRLMLIRKQNNYSSLQQTPYSTVPYPYCKTNYQDYSVNIAQGTSGLGPEYQIRLPLCMGRPVKTNIILELPLSMFPLSIQDSPTNSGSTTPDSDYCKEEEYYDDCSGSGSFTSQESDNNNCQPAGTTSQDNTLTGATTGTSTDESCTSNNKGDTGTSESCCAEIAPNDCSDISTTTEAGEASDQCTELEPADNDDIASTTGTVQLESSTSSTTTTTISTTTTEMSDETAC